MQEVEIPPTKYFIQKYLEIKIMKELDLVEINEIELDEVELIRADEIEMKIQETRKYYKDNFSNFVSRNINHRMREGSNTCWWPNILTPRNLSDQELKDEMEAISLRLREIGWWVCIGGYQLSDPYRSSNLTIEWSKEEPKIGHFGKFLKLFGMQKKWLPPIDKS